MATENEFQIYPVRQFGVRRNFFFGADRGLTIFWLFFSFTIVFGSAIKIILPGVIVGIFCWFVGIFVLRLAAKNDPLLRWTLWRHITRYKKYYPAHSSPFRRCTRIYKNASQRAHIF